MQFWNWTNVLTNTEVGVCVVLYVAGRWRKYRWINAHHHSRYNLLFLSLPRPARTLSFSPHGWQLRPPVVIRLPALRGTASRLYVWTTAAFSSQHPISLFRAIVGLILLLEEDDYWWFIIT
jgi:hypothetical protein